MRFDFGGTTGLICRFLRSLRISSVSYALSPRRASGAEQFGARYQQRGHELGGHGHTTVDGIDRLRLDAERATLLLLCMEEAPGDCHRGGGTI